MPPVAGNKTDANPDIPIVNEKGLREAGRIISMNNDGTFNVETESPSGNTTAIAKWGKAQGADVLRIGEALSAKEQQPLMASIDEMGEEPIQATVKQEKAEEPAPKSGVKGTSR